MDHFEYRDGVLYAEDVNLVDLAETVGTPFYCYSTATLRHHYGVLHNACAKAGLSDTLIERVRELIRDFQGKTVALSRTDADYFMKLLRLQAWFLENLERRLGVGREKMLGVYEDVLQSHAPPARALVCASVFSAWVLR